MKLIDTKKSETKIRDITPLELDALRETANIGTGNAAFALSNIFKRQVTISLPVLTVSTTDDISNVITNQNEMVVGIYSKITEGMEGNILTLMPINAAMEIVRAFFKDNADNKSLSEKDKQVLQKLGVSIYSSYLTSIAKFLKKRVLFSPPSIISTHGNSIHEFLQIHLGNNEKIIVIKLNFEVGKTKIKGDFLLLLTYNSITPLLANIDKKMS